MKNKTTILIILLLYGYSLFSQNNNDWQPASQDESAFFKTDGFISYVVDSGLNITQRNRVVAKTREYIAKDLAILNESEFNSPMHILSLSDKNIMHKLFGLRRAVHGVMEHQNGMSIIYIEDPEYSFLNKELMNFIIILKWGEPYDNESIWIKEGLSTYATPEAYSCDGYTIEERYAYFLLNEKLLNIKQFPSQENALQYKVACNQSAYIVEYLLEHYGIDKLRQLWKDGMADFENIYGLAFENLISKANDKLITKYPTLIDFSWSRFQEDCINFPDEDWLSAYNSIRVNSQLDRMVTREVGKLKFTVDSTMTIAERNDIIAKTNAYINDCLGIIGEQPFPDSIHIYLVPTRNEMKDLYGGDIGGIAGLKDEYMPENMVSSIYGNGYSPLKHEMMHIVSYLKWGKPKYNQTSWLVEGLAVYGGPESLDCDGHSMEERYAYLLQSDKLLSIDLLLDGETDGEMSDKTVRNKIFYCQSGYIVGYLIENYGVDKLKKIWQSEMIDFEKIYGFTFESLIQKINTELNEKYPDPIDFNWEMFKVNCFK